MTNEYIISSYHIMIDKKLRSSKIIFCITGNIAIVILSLALLAVFVYLLEDSQRHVPKNFLNSSTKSIAPSPSEPILIKCYDMYQVESVVVNRTQGIEFYTIYQSKLQSSMENSLLPPIKIGPFVEIFNNSVRLNYNGDDLPVYTADTGYIMLEVSGKTINPDTCAVELLLFNDLHQFHNFLNDEQFTRLNNTCLNLDEQIHNMRVNFTLSTPGFYYVGARVLDGLSMNVTVTVSRAVFNSSRLTKEKCIDKTCEVKISKSSVPIGKGRKKCLFVQFPSDGIEADGVLQIEVKYLKFNAVSLCYMILATSSALVIIFVCIFTTIIIITITFKRCKKRFSSPFLEEGNKFIILQLVKNLFDFFIIM